MARPGLADHTWRKTQKRCSHFFGIIWLSALNLNKDRAKKTPSIQGSLVKSHERPGESVSRPRGICGATECSSFPGAAGDHATTSADNLEGTFFAGQSGEVESDGCPFTSQSRDEVETRDDYASVLFG